MRVILLLLLMSVPALAQDPIVEFEAHDPEMAAAIGDARATLDGFFARVEDGPAVEDPLVEAAIPKERGKGVEHVWVAVTARDGDAFEGVLTNEPVFFDAAPGDLLAFDRSQITDWTYWEGDRLHGAYTIRVMLPSLDPAEAEALRAQLAPLPEG